MTFKTIASQIIITFLISSCAAPQVPWAGVEIYEPENYDEAYYFFRSARVIKFKESDYLDQARLDLERIVKANQTILFPEAYPLLVEAYNQLGLVDSSGWIYPHAFAKLEADPKLATKYLQRFESWQAAYPSYPTEFQSADYKLLESSAEPVGGYQHIYRILEYPEMAREMNRTGVSWYAILIEADGTVSNVQLLKSSYPDLDEAALKAINECDWVAAKYDGRPVTFQVIYPIYFRL